jgi:hypothetical protein
MHRPALLVLLTLFSLTAGPSAQLLDRILAVVDGAAITQSDATAAIRLGLVAPGDAKDPLGTAVDMLVERRLMLEEVDRYAPPDPPEAEIARRLAEIRTRAGNQYSPILDQAGMTEEQLRREVRNDLRIEAYLQQRFGTVQSSNERGAMIRDWLAGLRRRANINVLPR